MELSEALLFVAAIVLIVFISIGMEKYFSPKGKLIVAIISMLFLVGMFTSNLVENFSYRRLITTSLFFVVCIYSTYRQYKKYKKETQPVNYSSPE